MRTISAILILAALAACAPSGFLEYRPPHWEGQDWAITGKADAGPEKDFIIIKINDKDALAGNLTKDKPEQEFIGTFEGYNISAKCKLLGAGKDKINHRCEMLIEGEKAGSLSF